MKYLFCAQHFDKLHNYCKNCHSVYPGHQAAESGGPFLAFIHQSACQLGVNLLMELRFKTGFLEVVGMLTWFIYDDQLMFYCGGYTM